MEWKQKMTPPKICWPFNLFTPHTHLFDFFLIDSHLKYVNMSYKNVLFQILKVDVFFIAQKQSQTVEIM